MQRIEPVLEYGMGTAVRDEDTFTGFIGFVLAAT